MGGGKAEDITEKPNRDRWGALSASVLNFVPLEKCFVVFLIQVPLCLSTWLRFDVICPECQ